MSMVRVPGQSGDYLRWPAKATDLLSSDDRAPVVHVYFGEISVPYAWIDDHAEIVPDHAETVEDATGDRLPELALDLARKLEAAETYVYRLRDEIRDLREQVARAETDGCSRSDLDRVIAAAVVDRYLAGQDPSDLETLQARLGDYPVL